MTRALASLDPERTAILQGGAQQLMGPARRERTAAADSSVDSSHTGPIEASSGGRGVIADLHQATTNVLRDALGTDRLLQLRGEGAALDFDQVIALALDTITRAQTATPP